jgi:hypothetical protein
MFRQEIAILRGGLIQRHTKPTRQIYTYNAKMLKIFIYAKNKILKINIYLLLTF